MAVSAALATAFVAAPLSVRAVPAPSPIAIDRCVVPQFANHNLINDGLTVGTGGVRIAFRDQLPARATEVTFRVGYPGNVTTIRDVGTFSTGTQVVHQYSSAFNESDFAGSRPTTCEVVAARFADGSAWTSPERKAP
jgi:hypothetical protein